MTNALRKAPQHTAVGFKQTVSKQTGGAVSQLSEGSMSTIQTLWQSLVLHCG